VVASFGASLVVLLDAYGTGGVNPKQVGSWDLGWLLVIGCVELWSVTHRVPVHAYRYMNEEYSCGIFSYFHFGWYTRVVSHMRS
jgi:hypothetical protein